MIGRHVSRCCIAGLVALLPVGGLVLSVLFMEDAIAGSWLARQDYHVPGMGLAVVALGVYLIGLVVTSFLGRWIWARIDALLDALPAIGRLYKTLKQILGYGEGEDALFREVVALPGRAPGTEELGLVTNRLTDASGREVLAVFLPGAPNPTMGRLVYVAPEVVRKTERSVSDTLGTLLALGGSDGAAAADGAAPDAAAGGGR